LDFLFYDYAVAVVGNQNVAQTVDAFTVQFGVTHHEAAFVVVFPAARHVMVQSAASGDYDVNKFAFNQFFDDAAGACGDYVCGEGEELDTALLFNHVLQNAYASCELARRETPRSLHLVDKLVYAHVFGDLVIFNSFLHETSTFADGIAVSELG
jgi:hypothetical protein